MFNSRIPVLGLDVVLESVATFLVLFNQWDVIPRGNTLHLEFEIARLSPGCLRDDANMVELKKSE